MSNPIGGERQTMWLRRACSGAFQAKKNHPKSNSSRTVPPKSRRKSDIGPRYRIGIGLSLPARILPLFSPAGMGSLGPRGTPKGRILSAFSPVSGSRGYQPLDRRRLSWAPPGRTTGRWSPGWNVAPLLDPDRGMPGTV